MISGRLRHKITLEDEEGVRYEDVRAQVRGIGSVNTELGGMDVGEVSNVIVMRLTPSGPRPSARWKVYHGDRTFRVRGAYDPKGQNRELMLSAQELR